MTDGKKALALNHLLLTCTGAPQKIRQKRQKNSTAKIKNAIKSTCISSCPFLVEKSLKFPFKRHCHTVRQLYKKLEGVFASIEFQN